MKLLLILFLFCSFCLSAAELSCSRTGLRILYINGVNTNKVGRTVTVGNIRNSLQEVLPEIDKKALVTVEGVTNDTLGLGQDLFKLKAGVEEFTLGKDNQYDFWRKFAQQEVAAYEMNKSVSGELPVSLDTKVEEAFDQIYGKQYRINPKTKKNDQNYLTNNDLFRVLYVYSQRVGSLINTVAVSETVVNNLKNRIIEAHENGRNKVIVIAHSQGNVVLENALNRIYLDYRNANPTPQIESAERSWFNQTVGFIHLASPINTSENSRKKYILADADFIIGNASYMTQVRPSRANYAILDKPVLANYAYSEKFKALGQLLNLGHSVDDDYLSETLKARDDRNIEASMADHFRANIKSIAENLGNNCVNNLKFTAAYCRAEYKNNEYRAIGGVDTFFISSNSDQRVKPLNNNECRIYEDQDGVITGCAPLNQDASNINISFKTIGDDTYSSLRTNPCYEGRLLPDGPMLKL